MANVDFTEQIADFRGAKYGEDVRDSLIDIAEAVETAINNQLIQVDDTLTESGQGADAAKVGQEISALKEKISIAEDQTGTTITVKENGSTELYVLPNYGVIGRMSGLETDSKLTLVGAINEVNGKIDDLTEAENDRFITSAEISEVLTG